LREIYEDCVSGRILCGQCKRRAAEKLKSLLIEHQKRYREIKSSVEKYVKNHHSKKQLSYLLSRGLHRRVKIVLSTTLIKHPFL